MLKPIKLINFIILLSILSIFLSTYVSAEFINGTISMDSWVHQYTPNDLHGDNVVNSIRHSSSLGRITYIGFDISDQLGVYGINDITNMTLYAYLLYNSVNSSSVNFSYTYCDSIFNEDAITWNNRDTQVTNCDLGYFYELPTNETGIEVYIPLDLTAVLQNETDGIFTIRIENTPYSVGTVPTTGFNSKESTEIPYLEIYIGEQIPDLEINISSPTNNLRSNVHENITYTVIQSTVSDMVCDLYVDSVFNATNSSVINNTLSKFEVSWSEKVHTFQINCSDNESSVNSSLYTFEYDATEPFITSISPSYLNTTVYSNYTMNIAGNVTDNSLYRGNFTILYPNGTVYYNNYTGNLSVNTTEYSWDWTFNTSYEPNGVWELQIDFADSHTAKFLRDADLVEKDQDNKKLRYVYADTDMSIQYIGGNVLGQFENITTSKHFDRYDFELNFKKTINPNSIMTFRITSNKPLDVIEGSEYPCHAITDDYWIDFAGIDAEYEATVVDSNTYDCEIKTSNPQDKIVFNSLGGLNENNELISFNVGNCESDWSCVGYTSCAINDTQYCNNVTDVNVCGLPYNGDYSEFGDLSCDYCDDDIQIENQTSCTGSLWDICYVDVNFATCCNVTGIATDCYDDTVQNESIYCFEDVECSLFGYSGDDIPRAMISTIVKGLVVLSVFIGIIMILVGINYLWFRFGFEK